MGSGQNLEAIETRHGQMWTLSDVELSSSRVTIQPSHPASRSPYTTTVDTFTRGGIQIRRLELGHCVRDDEWKQFVELNKVHSSPHSGCAAPDIWIAFISIVHAEERTIRKASSTVHTRSETLPPSSRLSFGFAISKEVPCRQAATLPGQVPILGSPKNLTHFDRWRL